MSRRFLAPVFLAFALAVSGARGAPANNVFDAAAIDDLRDVKKLLDAGADEKALDAHGDPLLTAAIRNDAPKVTDYLLERKGIDLEATNVSNETPLMIAAYRKQKDTVEKLLAHGAEVNRVGWTALHYAASVDAGDIVDVLLEHAAYIDAESPNKTTPLMMAARGGFDDLCHRLVEAGADPTPVNERDLTAADFATRAGIPSLAQWLTLQAAAWRAKYGATGGSGR